jgi:hypothetical protein
MDGKYSAALKILLDGNQYGALVVEILRLELQASGMQ